MYVQMILFIHMIPLFFTLPCWLENLHRWFSQEEPLLSAISSIVTILGVVAVFVYYRKVRISRNCRRKIILDLTRHLFVNCAIVEATRLCMQRSGGAERPVDGTFLRFAFLEDDTNLERFSLTSKSFDLIHELNLFMRNYNIAAGVAESHFADPAYPGECVKEDVETVTRNIREKLVAGIRKRLDADAPIGFLLSGGLDSSLVCAVSARILKKPPRTFAIGMDTDAIDLKYAARVAGYIGAEHTEVIIDRNDVLSSLEDVIAALGTFDITTIRASVGMYLVCKFIREHTDIKVLLTGEVSDELFGYKYTDFAPTPEAFGQEAAKRVRELYMYDVLRADRCISVHGMEARVPFGDLDFVRYVMRIDPAMKMNVYGKGKYLLRKAFEGDLLPQEILWREKAAFSDAVGHSMVGVIREYAESRFTDEEFEKRRARYSHARPFTKESLLYRELFEKYYPRTSSSVADFWMPNREWKGLRGVNDPSARVLSNYGASGI